MDRLWKKLLEADLEDDISSHTPHIPGQGEQDSTKAPTPPSPPAGAKRARNAVQLIPRSRFINLEAASGFQTCPSAQDKEEVTPKRPRTRSSASSDELSSGIPNSPSPRGRNAHQTSPDARYPLAGCLRVSESRSMSCSSGSGSEALPSDFVINKG